MTDTFAQTDSRSETPLCSHYFSVSFAEQAVQLICSDGGSRELMVSWALGTLRSGQWEVLGARPVLEAGPTFWRSVFDDFTVRGVERPISIVLTDAVVDVRAACPDAAALLPPFGRILRRRGASFTSDAGRLGLAARRAVREAGSARTARVALERLLRTLGAGEAPVLASDWPEVLEQLEAFYALSPRRRAQVRISDEALDRLGRTLGRAVARHGPFADQDAATSFVASTLARAEQRLEA